MDNFKIIYQILKALEVSMDYEAVDINKISPERFKITQNRWDKLMIMLYKSGYIDGIVIDASLYSGSEYICEPINPTITLLGLEYLSENTTMKNVAKALKGIKDTIPGM